MTATIIKLFATKNQIEKMLLSIRAHIQGAENFDILPVVDTWYYGLKGIDVDIIRAAKQLFLQKWELNRMPQVAEFKKYVAIEKEKYYQKKAGVNFKDIDIETNRERIEAFAEKTRIGLESGKSYKCYFCGEPSRQVVTVKDHFALYGKEYTGKAAYACEKHLKQELNNAGIKI